MSEGRAVDALLWAAWLAVLGCGIAVIWTIPVHSNGTAYASGGTLAGRWFFTGVVVLAWAAVTAIVVDVGRQGPGPRADRDE